MRTLPRNITERTVRNYEAECTICGTVWLRKDLTLDSEGSYRCRDCRHGRNGLDLSIANTQALARDYSPETPQDGKIPGEQSEFYTSPQTIFGDGLAGWWDAQHALYSDASRVDWDNLAAGDDGHGDILGVLTSDETLMPIRSSSQLTFSSHPVWSRPVQFSSAGPASLYVLGSVMSGGLAAAADTAPKGAPDWATQTTATAVITLRVTSGRYVAEAWYQAAGPTKVIGPTVDGQGHLFEVAALQGELRLHIDGVLRGTQAVGAADTVGALRAVTIGGDIRPGEGTTATTPGVCAVKMAALVSGTVTETQRADMKAYAVRKHEVSL